MYASQMLVKLRVQTPLTGMQFLKLALRHRLRRALQLKELSQLLVREIPATDKDDDTTHIAAK